MSHMLPRRLQTNIMANIMAIYVNSEQVRSAGNSKQPSTATAMIYCFYADLLIVVCSTSASPHP